MSEFTRVAVLSDLPSGSVHGVDVDGHHIAICNHMGDIRAVAGTCTHADADLCDGELEDGELVCPLHFAKFCTRTGHATEPPADEPLRTYEVKVEGEDILVRVD
jgi:nitrite reductase/ring-hydroxylating ferredoxin subunit